MFIYAPNNPEENHPSRILEKRITTFKFGFSAVIVMQMQQFYNEHLSFIPFARLTFGEF